MIPVEQMMASARALLEALRKKDAAAIKGAASRFVHSVEASWRAFEDGEIAIHMRGRAFPLMMYNFAVVELPERITDPESWPALAQELRGFINMIGLLAPSDTTDESS